MKRALALAVALAATALPVAAGADPVATHARPASATDGLASCPPMPRRAPAGYAIALADSFARGSLSRSVPPEATDGAVLHQP